MNTFIRSLFLAAALSFLFFSGSIMAYEEPEYEVIAEYDEFEIREYSSYLVAETEIDSTFEEAGNAAFQFLFDYISGKNVKQEEIEMTIPVNQSNAEPEGEKIEMTTPVNQSAKLNAEGQYVISFVMPLKYTMETIPTPKNDRVKIRKVESKTVAVREYSGTWSEENFRENEQILLEELRKENIETIGTSNFARYNPPFWPWFLRTNEVQIEIDPATIKN